MRRAGRSLALALGLAMNPTIAAAAPSPCDAEPIATPDGPLLLPAHAAWTHWTLDAPTRELRLTVEVVSDPGSGVGLYFSPWNGQIGGSQMYLGLQTDLHHPEEGWVGKGVIFSRWGRRSEADIRVAKGGFYEIAGHEGDFVGVRMPYPWTVGTYTLVLRLASGNAEGDWYTLTIDDGRTSTRVGALRFPRQERKTPVIIQPEGTAFLEVYSGATAYDQVPDWHVSAVPAGDVAQLVGAVSAYPSHPYAPFPNADVWVEPGSPAVHLAFGRTVRRCHAEGALLVER